MTTTTSTEDKAFTMPSLLNRSRIRKLALDISKSKGRRFQRVGASFFERIEAAVRTQITNEVHRHPSVGVTLK